MENNEIIWVDMDNTICDCRSAYLQALEETPEIKWPQSQHGFFRNLKPIDKSISVVKILASHFDVKFLTRPSTRNRLCYTEKADWIYEHFGQNGVDNLYFAPDKGLIKGIGGYLIDDTLWPGFEGTQLLYGSVAYSDWFKIYNYFRELKGYSIN